MATLVVWGLGEMHLRIHRHAYKIFWFVEGRSIDGREGPGTQIDGPILSDSAHQTLSWVWHLGGVIGVMTIVSIGALQMFGGTEFFSQSTAGSVAIVVALIWSYGFLAAVDGETGLVLDNLPWLIGLGGILAAILGVGLVDPVDSTLGALLALLAGWGLAELWPMLRGVRALGSGDARLFAAAAAWTGLTGLGFFLIALSVIQFAAFKAVTGEVMKGSGTEDGPLLGLPLGPAAFTALMMIVLAKAINTVYQH